MTPMKPSIFKLTFRSIRAFPGRYIALLLIVFLSVGFFSGLKVTKDAMANTCGDYLSEQQFYDYRLFSTLGFSDDDVTALSALPFAEAAEGSKSVEAMMEYAGSDTPFVLLTLPEEVNLPSLVAGKMPETDGECLADAKAFTEADIGSVISLASENDETVTEQLARTEYTIAGLVNSPLYLGDDRGTTSIGGGALEGFLYLPAENFTRDAYTEISVTLAETAPAYSDEYDDLTEGYRSEVTDVVKQLAQDRYESILSENGLEAELAAQFGITEPETYVLTRSENAGYVSFENDTSIVSGIANIFPIFFILIALLVCMTTMTRMVDEERTQIGVLKAMGFGNGAITAKYLLYAESVTVMGWAIGFFLGTWGLPKIFWFAYSSLYDFAPLSYLFSPFLALLTLAVSLIGILGGTIISCWKELGSAPAKLIRPRAAKTGKRILLERITPMWNRLPFLQKITLRNMFRYKQRLVMLLVGVSCCTGLVVTAFGVRDSMIDIGTLQYETVQKYDMEASFTDGAERDVCMELDELAGIEQYLTCSVHRVDLHGAEAMNSVNLYSFADTDRFSDFWNFHSGGSPVPFPAEGAAIVSTRVAEKLELSVGDTFEVRDADMQTMTVSVGGVFDNYVDNFVIVSANTFETAFGPWAANTALISASQNTQTLAEKLTETEAITSVIQLSTTRESIDSALSCLNYIIWLIVLFSGALAFIVIFNLTNINLAERSREIATVEVLGFYPKETESYVLRENMILSVLAGFIGLPLGNIFHHIVMDMIVIDSMSFDIHITTVSYALAFICTVLFAAFVNLFMKRQLTKIPMAESLKAVE